MYYLGVDLGSLSCDAVLLGDNGDVLASSVVPTGARNQEAVARAVDEVLKNAGITRDGSEPRSPRDTVSDRVEQRLAAVTEITCHAHGIKNLFQGTHILLDIGGQDSKAVRLDADGQVIDFAMNDKCAAGTGRFLEAMARALQVDIEELSDLDIGASGDVTLSSMCTVFAESEVVSLIADGVDVNEIVSGLNRAIASRIVALVRRIAPDSDGLSIAMSGGVAHNHGVVRALSQIFGTTISVPPKPDTVGALGAAL